MDTEYYDVLGVDKTSDPQTIKKAYYQLSRKYHPDRLQGEEKEIGEEKIKEINHAYEVLSDPQKRKLYDQFGKRGLEQGNFQDMSSMFERPKVAPIEANVNLYLKDIYMGTTIPITFDRKNLCYECNKTGTKDGTRHPCKTCHGKKYIRQAYRNGPFIQEHMVECRSCDGNGIAKGTPLCDKCSGNGFTLESHTITHEIPRGVSITKGLQIPNVGHEIPSENSDKQRGDVIILINEIEDVNFKRHNGLDLTVSIHLTLAESICGFKRVIEHLDGRKLAVIVTEPVNNGDVRLIKHEGMYHQSKQSVCGNLLVQFFVDMPKSLTETQKESIYSVLTNEKYSTLDLNVSENEIYTRLEDNAYKPIDDDDHDHEQHHFNTHSQNIQCSQQ